MRTPTERETTLRQAHGYVAQAAGQIFSAAMVLEEPYLHLRLRDAERSLEAALTRIQELREEAQKESVR